MAISSVVADYDQCTTYNPPCPYSNSNNQVADNVRRVRWDDGGAGGAFGTLDVNGEFVPLANEDVDHIDRYKAHDTNARTVHLALLAEDEGREVVDADGTVSRLVKEISPPNYASNPSPVGDITVWEFTISNGATGWLPTLDSDLYFTANITPAADHNGNPMDRVISFQLYSSREPGYCMNASRESSPNRHWDDTYGPPINDMDLKFYPVQNGPPSLTIFSQDPNNQFNYSSAITDSVTRTVTVRVRCLDYGASGSIDATASFPGMPIASARLEGTLPKDNELGAQIPVDKNPAPLGNRIADAWLYEPRPEGDLDYDPALGQNDGDGVVKYEEYRGFIINGSHFRSDPGQKMLWLVPEEGDTYFRSRYHIGYAGTLMTAVYEITENWLLPINSLHPNWPNDRRINWMSNRNPPEHYDQSAVRIVDGGFRFDPDMGLVYGATDQIVEVPTPFNTPNNTVKCNI